MSKEITPTPWRWVSDCCHGFDYLVGGEYKTGKGGCTSDDIILSDGSVCGEYNKAISKEDANAKHIVKCVNENEALHARIKELEDGIKDACSRWVVNIDGQLIGNSIIENNSNILLADIPIAKRWINANLIQGLMNREGK